MTTSRQTAQRLTAKVPPAMTLSGRLRTALVGAVAMTVALGTGGPAVAAPSPSTPSPSTPPSLPGWVRSADKVASNDGYSAAETDWASRDVSTRTVPAELLAAAGQAAVASSRMTVNLVAVRNVGGSPTVSTVRTSGGAAARAAIQRLQGDPSVVSLAVDRRRKVLSAPSRTAAVVCEAVPSSSAQWDYTALGLAGVHGSGVTGAGTTVAVIDSGVNGNHPDLKGQVLSGTDLVRSGNGWNDMVGHGTHVAGTVAALNNGTGITGVAPGAKVLPVRVADADGYAWDSDTAAGIQYSVNRGAQVLNLSLAGTSDAVVSTMVKYAQSKNVLVVAAAGNERDYGNPVRYPAAYPGVLAVGATDENGSPTFFSEAHPYVRIAAPGMNIVSTFPTVSSAPQGLCEMAGTSMASPHVAGAAALLFDVNSQVRGSRALAFLIGTTTHTNTPGFDVSTGFGIVNPAAAVNRVRCWVAKKCGTPLANVSDNAGQRWVQRAHVHLSGAGPTTTALLTWPGWVASGTKPGTGMTYPLTASTYYRQRAVQTYLYRAARRTGPASSVNYYASLLGKGYTEQRVYSILMASSETYKRAGNTNASWVTYTYREVIGFTPPASAVKVYTSALARGVSRQAVANSMISSGPGLARIVDVQYQRYLGHAPSATMRTYWTKRLAAGVLVRAMAANLVAGAEYRSKR